MGCKRRDRQEGSAKMKDLEALAAEIGAMQEAGDYENTLTYICTPTY